MVKVHISYEPEDETLVARIMALLKGILPPFKTKKKQGQAPYNHMYIIPIPHKNGGEPMG